MNLEPSNRPGLSVLGKLSSKMLYATILGNLYFQITRWCTGPVRVWCIIKMCPVNLRVYFLGFGSTMVPDKGPINEVEDSLQVERCDA